MKDAECKMYPLDVAVSSLYLLIHLTFNETHTVQKNEHPAHICDMLQFRLLLLLLVCSHPHPASCSLLLVHFPSQVKTGCFSKVMPLDAQPGQAQEFSSIVVSFFPAIHKEKQNHLHLFPSMQPHHIFHDNI